MLRLLSRVTHQRRHLWRRCNLPHSRVPQLALKLAGEPPKGFQVMAQSYNWLVVPQPWLPLLVRLPLLRRRGPLRLPLRLAVQLLLLGLPLFIP